MSIFDMLCCFLLKRKVAELIGQHNDTNNNNNFTCKLVEPNSPSVLLRPNLNLT